MTAWKLLQFRRAIMKIQIMLETLIKKAGHEYIFLPKFHFELNLVIEMVSCSNVIYYMFSL